MKRRAYIDIETTGLSKHYAELTVIGIGLEKGSSVEITQLTEKTLLADKIIESLLEYNREDVVNLRTLRVKLGVE